MTKRKFIALGLFIIALGPLIAALQSYLLIQHKIRPELLSTAFVFPGIYIIFGILFWDRLKYLGKRNAVITLYIAAYIALLFSYVELSNYMYQGVSAYYPSDMIDEIAAWSKTGGHGEFHFSMKATFKHMAFNAGSGALMTWPYVLTLLVGSRGPRSPSQPSIAWRAIKGKVKNPITGENPEKRGFA